MVTPLFRKPQRISITLPYQAYCDLVERSSREGRSISNLAAFLVEAGLSNAIGVPEQGSDERAA